MKDLEEDNVGKVTITCDDFGLDRGTNHAILELASEGKISATSILVSHLENTEDAYHQLLKIKESSSSLRLGLHLNLTEAPSLTNDWISNGLIKCLSHSFMNVNQDMKKEVEAQIQKFSDLFGRPDHIDGHQHILYLPKLHKFVKGLSDSKFSGSIPMRSYPFQSTLTNTKATLLTQLSRLTPQSELPRKHNTVLIDLEDLIKERVTLNSLSSKNIEIMAHVAHPAHRDSQREEEKSVDFGTFSFENRVRQFEFLMKNTVI